MVIYDTRLSSKQYCIIFTFRIFLLFSWKQDNHVFEFNTFLYKQNFDELQFDFVETWSGRKCSRLAAHLTPSPQPGFLHKSSPEYHTDSWDTSHSHPAVDYRQSNERDNPRTSSVHSYTATQ